MEKFIDEITAIDTNNVVGESGSGLEEERGGKSAECSYCKAREPTDRHSGGPTVTVAKNQLWRQPDHRSNHEC
jgi:hypothetical protein